MNVLCVVDRSNLQVLLNVLCVAERSNLQVLLNVLCVAERSNLQVLLNVLCVAERSNLQVLSNVLCVAERSNLQVLYDDLLDGYNPNVRPVLHNTHSVQIHANMKMQQIISMVRDTLVLKKSSIYLTSGNLYVFYLWIEFLSFFSLNYINIPKIK